MPKFQVCEIARLCGGSAEGDLQREIDSANAIDLAGPQQLSFAQNEKVLERAGEVRAGCLLVPPAFANRGGLTIIRVGDPRAAFAQVVSLLYPAPAHRAAIHPSAVISLSARLADDCFIGPNVVIGEHSSIAGGSVIHAGCVIGDNVTIGEHCVVHPNVTIYTGVRIGSRVVVHAGAVIGSDGFGYIFSNGHYEKFPQIGTVEIGDDVELGANTCIDRAALGATVISEGAKLDNLVHVAHGCRIGKHVAVAAQTGFSGGSVVGDFAIIAGQVGVADKVTIESKAVVGAQAGIPSSKIIRAGEPVWGTPARPIKEHLRQLAALGKLPEALEELKQVQKRLQRLEQAE